MMAIIGVFAFSANHREFHSLEKNIKYNYAKISRISASPEYHAVGGREESITINGRVNAVEGGTDPMMALEMMAELKIAYPMFLGTGRYMGLFIIESVTSKGSKPIDNGAMLQIDFTVKLTRADGGLISWIKSTISTLGGLF